jgi:hypothetical protein
MHAPLVQIHQFLDECSLGMLGRLRDATAYALATGALSGPQAVRLTTALGGNERAPSDPVELLLRAYADPSVCEAMRLAIDAYPAP